MKKAVIFDMDGLMIDSERVTYEGYVRECEKRGFEMTLPFFKTLLGYPMGPIRQKLIEHYGKDFPLEEIIKDVHRYMEELFAAQGVPKKPGLMEILRYTCDKGYKTMVATSSDRDRVEWILRNAEIEEYFDDIICGNEVKRGKPHPDIFEEACRKLGVKPEEAYVIEDSEMGVLAAFRAGIDVICVPDMKEPGEETRKNAMCVVESLTKAKEVIDRRDGNGGENYD